MQQTSEEARRRGDERARARARARGFKPLPFGKRAVRSKQLHARAAQSRDASELLVRAGGVDGDDGVARFLALLALVVGAGFPALRASAEQIAPWIDLGRDGRGVRKVTARAVRLGFIAKVPDYCEREHTTRLKSGLVKRWSKYRLRNAYVLTAAGCARVGLPAPATLRATLAAAVAANDEKNAVDNLSATCAQQQQGPSNASSGSSGVVSSSEITIPSVRRSCVGVVDAGPAEPQCDRRADSDGDEVRCAHAFKYPPSDPPASSTPTTHDTDASQKQLGGAGVPAGDDDDRALDAIRRARVRWNAYRAAGVAVDLFALLDEED